MYLTQGDPGPGSLQQPSGWIRSEGHFLKRMGKALVWELVRRACGHCHCELFWKKSRTFESLKHELRISEVNPVSASRNLHKKSKRYEKEVRRVRWKNRLTIWGFVQSIVLTFGSVLPLYSYDPPLQFASRSVYISLGSGHVLTYGRRTTVVPGACSGP